MPDTTNFSNSTVSSQSARLAALQTLISYMQFDAQSRRFPVATAEYVVWITAPDQLRYADDQPQAYDGYRWLAIDGETMQVWAERENVTLPEETTAMTNTLTSDEQQFVDATRRYPKTTYRKDEVNRLLAIIDRLTTTQPAAPDDDPPDPPSCRWCDGTGTTLTGPVEDCDHCNGTGYADGKPRTYGTAEPPQPAAPATEYVCWTTPDGEIKSRMRPVAPAEPTLTPADAAHFAAMADERDAPAAPDPDTRLADTPNATGRTRLRVKAAPACEHKYHELNDGTRGIDGQAIPFLKCERCDHIKFYDDAIDDGANDYAEYMKLRAAYLAKQPAPTPRPVKLTLTKAQRSLLERLAKGPMGYDLYRTRQSSLRVLLRNGFACWPSGPWNGSAEITAKGRAALSEAK